MRNFMFFDANCIIGKPADRTMIYAKDIPSLAEKMDYAGVDFALIRHINAKALSPLYTNEEIARMIWEDDSGRFYGVWSILPEQCGELPHPDEFFKQMKAARIRALTMYPAQHRWIPCRFSIGKLMDACKERSIPFLISGNDFSQQWESIYSLLEEFPDNIYICHSGGLWGVERILRPLLENYPNVYFESSDYWRPEGLLDLAEKYGAGRFLYGSGFPVYNHGNTMPMIKHLQLPEKDKLAIAGGNLKRIIDEVSL